MLLAKTVGNIIEKNQRSRPTNLLGGVEVDYYFMASKFSGSKTEISLVLWTIVVDEEGYIYGLLTRHLGHYNTWKEVISNRIKEHLIRLGLDNLFVNRLVREIEIKKEGHIIPKDIRCGGDRIGVDGSDEIYIRRSKFTYFKITL
ncbi:hypothetical protein ML462_01160 [Gramella lutea]|uniref:Uncharacterized protein n=1 Tax=Christiangramia lutea TaxID=1607951 RepID=A0A9X1V008_9FLAO|nr:hypothetical protein [Christiangramia lutea]MCH4821767.1 hypothetical protein [Christiangramia lutea]